MTSRFKGYFRTRKPVILAGSILLGVVALLLAGFTWNEARKEVVFLCGNFTGGVSQESVIRQLETGHFLRFRREQGTPAERIVVDSAYTMGTHSCTIDFDGERKVVRAFVD